ncbi:MAG: hypothetical protein P8P44_03515 [Alphaproteobacteria bacterium]|nr:hypothetical protein [Alphaproteobacteria bacterium]
MNGETYSDRVRQTLQTAQNEVQDRLADTLLSGDIEADAGDENGLLIAVKNGDIIIKPQAETAH